MEKWNFNFNDVLLQLLFSLALLWKARREETRKHIVDDYRHDRKKKNYIIYIIHISCGKSTMYYR